MPAYAHQIPTGFIQLLLNNHRDNLYIISFFYEFPVTDNINSFENEIVITSVGNHLNCIFRRCILIVLTAKQLNIAW